MIARGFGDRAKVARGGCNVAGSTLARFAIRWAVLAGVGMMSGCTASGRAEDAAPSSSCVASQGVSASPAGIADAVALVDDLVVKNPDGLTVPCFVESLARPLGALAVNSTFSVQPADGPRSPRIFLFTGNLAMSIATAGAAAASIELAEYVTPTRSIKGEIGFPLTRQVLPAEPYDRVLRDGGGTNCGICHRDEATSERVTITQAFESDVLRPRDQDEVSLSYLEDETRDCDPGAEPDRCAMLNAVFGYGALERRTFSHDARTIFDP